MQLYAILSCYSKVLKVSSKYFDAVLKNQNKVNKVDGFADYITLKTEPLETWFLLKWLTQGDIKLTDFYRVFFIHFFRFFYRMAFSNWKWC